VGRGGNRPGLVVGGSVGELLGRWWCHFEKMRTRRVKRVLLFVAQVGVLVGGPVAALALGVLVDNIRGDLAPLAFLVGLIATLAGFVLLVLRNTARRMEYDAADYPIEKANCRLYPRRERWKRVAKKIAVWVPSAIAAFVLFYFPQATHLRYLRGITVRHYRIPIPWRFGILHPPYSSHTILAFGGTGTQRRFGVTRSWGLWPQSSEMLFWSIDPDSAPQYLGHYRPRNPQMAKREFRIRDVTLTCLQYAGQGSISPESIIECKTPSDERERNLFAEFTGHQVDVSAFYGILEGVRLLQFAK